MLGKVGLTEIMIILGVVLIFWGPSRLPKLGRSIGETIKEFRGIKNVLKEGVEEAGDLKRAIERETRL